MWFWVLPSQHPDATAQGRSGPWAHLSLGQLLWPGRSARGPGLLDPAAVSRGYCLQGPQSFLLLSLPSRPICRGLALRAPCLSPRLPELAPRRQEVHIAHFSQPKRGSSLLFYSVLQAAVELGFQECRQTLSFSAMILGKFESHVGVRALGQLVPDPACVSARPPALQQPAPERRVASDSDPIGGCDASEVCWSRHAQAGAHRGDPGGSSAWCQSWRGHSRVPGASLYF